MKGVEPDFQLPTNVGQIENTNLYGTAISNGSTDPYGQAKGHFRNREVSAYFTHLYNQNIQKLRSHREDKDTIGLDAKGIPIEWYEFHRVIVDEVHEPLCTSKSETRNRNDENKRHKSKTGEDLKNHFADKNRRAGRELLGIENKNHASRPLQVRQNYMKPSRIILLLL